MCSVRVETRTSPGFQCFFDHKRASAHSATKFSGDSAVLAVGFEGIEEPGTHSGQTACCEDLKMTRTR